MFDCCPFCKETYWLVVHVDGICCKNCNTSLFIYEGEIISFHLDTDSYANNINTIGIYYDTNETIISVQDKEIILNKVITFESLDELKNKVKVYSVFS